MRKQKKHAHYNGIDQGRKGHIIMRQQKHAHYNGKGRVHYNGTRPRSSLKLE